MNNRAVALEGMCAAGLEGTGKACGHPANSRWVRSLLLGLDILLTVPRTSLDDFVYCLRESRCYCLISSDRQTVPSARLNIYRSTK